MNRFWRYAAAVVAVLVAALARYALDPFLGSHSPWILFIAAIVAASVYGGTGPGLLAFVLGGLIGDYLFITPHYDFKLDITGGFSLLLYIITGLTVVLLGAHARRAKREAEQKSQTVQESQQKLEREMEQRRQAEAEITRLNLELKHRVQELELLFQESPVGIAFTRDAECREVLANPAFHRLVQVPTGTNVSFTSNAANLPVRVLRDGVELRADELPMQRCIQTGKAIIDEELEICRPDGSSVIALISVKPLIDSDRPRGSIAITVDITERKRIEESLRASQAREHSRVRELETIMETTPAAILISDDPSCRLVRANQAGYAMFRLPPGANASKSVPTAATHHFRLFRDGSEIVHADLPLQRAARGIEVRNDEVDVLFNDGVTLHTVMNASPLRDDAGNVRGVVAALLDITERKRAESTLRDGVELFRGLAEGMPHMAWQTDAQGFNHYQNQVWYDYIGEGPGSSFGQDWLGYYHPDDLEHMITEWRRALSTEGAYPYDIEARIRRHDGVYRWFRITGAPIRNATGKVVKWVGTCTDIEESKRALEELREADRRKDQFLATLGHELRNPLAPIRNAIEIIRKGLTDERRRAWAVEVIDRQLYQLSRIIDDLLDLAKIAGGEIGVKKEPVSLRDVVSRAVETARPMIESKGQRLRVELPDGAFMVNADPARMIQAISNLLNNAARHTLRGGTILVALSARDHRVQLRVRDSGEGIDPKDLPRVFDMFRKSMPGTPENGGLGIGLAFAKRMVDLHGGRISVHSDGLGKGSEFVIELPLCVVEASDEVSMTVSSPLLNQTKRRILVVDDNRDTADSMSELLRMHGHEVACLYEGSGVVAKAHEFAPDLVLLDIGLPGTPGYDIARQFRADPTLRTMPLAALTGRANDADKQLAREAGFNAHFTKPVDIAEIVAFIEAASVSSPALDAAAQ